MSLSDFTEDATFGTNSSSPVYDLELDPNRPYILALRYSGDVDVYNKDDYTHVATVTGGSQPADSVDMQKLDIGPNGNTALAGTSGGSVNIYDISNSDPTNWTLNRSESVGGTPWGMAVHGTEQWCGVALAADGYEIYDYSGGGWSQIQSSSVTAVCLEFDDTGTFMGRGAASDSYVYDVRPDGNTWNQIATIGGHPSQANGISFDQNQNWVVVGTVDSVDVYNHGTVDGSGWGKVTSIEENSGKGEFASTGEYYVSPTGFSSASDVGPFEPNNGWNFMGDMTPSAVSGPVHSVYTMGSRLVFGDAGGSDIYAMNMPVSVQINGQVTLDNTPIEGAKVYLIDDTNDTLAQTTTTDVDGNYSFEVESGIVYHIGVEYQRYE